MIIPVGPAEAQELQLVRKLEVSPLSIAWKDVVSSP